MFRYGVRFGADSTCNEDRDMSFWNWFFGGGHSAGGVTG